MKNRIPSFLPQALASVVLLEVLAVTVPFFVLGNVFDFPDILRQPAAQALGLFRLNQGIIVPCYYLFLVSALLYIPLASLLRLHLKHQTKYPLWLELMYVSAIATAVFQAIGFSRWIFSVPFLSEQYALGVNTETIALIYEWSNRFVGTTVGEHLGFLAMGCWLVALSVALPLAQWFRWMGVSIGLMLMASTGEHFGGAPAPFFATLNLVSNVLWTVWMVVLAVSLVRKTPATPDQGLETSSQEGKAAQHALH